MGKASEVKAASEEMDSEESQEVDVPKENVEKEDGEAAAKAPKKRKKPRHPLDAEHPPTTDMILAALRDTRSIHKGITVAAIREIITRENTVRPGRLRHMLRQGFTKLLAKETICRPKGDVAKSVLLGRYKLPAKQAVVEGGKKEPPARPLRSNNLPIGPAKKKKKKARRHW